MTIDLGHHLGRLVHPIGFLWLILLAATIWLVARRKWRSGLVAGLLVFVLWGIGGTSIPARLLASMEKPYARAEGKQLPNADAVVMLGGTHDYSDYDQFHLNLVEAADRVVTAFELMRQHKAPALVLGGGGTERDEKSEAGLTEEWFKTWGLPAESVVTLGICRNTREEGERLQALMKERGWQRVLLVSSAYHLKRAEAVCKKLGISIVPVGSDFEGLSALKNQRAFHPLPAHDGFNLLRLYLREQVGWYYYRWRDWID